MEEPIPSEAASACAATTYALLSGPDAAAQALNYADAREMDMDARGRWFTFAFLMRLRDHLIRQHGLDRLETDAGSMVTMRALDAKLVSISETGISRRLEGFSFVDAAPGISRDLIIARSPAEPEHRDPDVIADEDRFIG